MTDFTKCRAAVEPANLLGMHRVSFEDFLQENIPALQRQKEGLQAIFQDVFPVKSHEEKLVLHFVEYRFDEPKHSAEKCRQEELTYSLPFYAKFRLINKETKRVLEKEIYLGEFPLMTEEETFVINGTQRIIIGQLQRSPGLFLEENTSNASGAPISYRARVIPERGNWLDFEVKNNLLFVSINRRRRFPATLFIRAMDGLPAEVLNKFANLEDKEILQRSFQEDGVNSRQEALLKIQPEICSGDSLASRSAKEVFDESFQDPGHYNLGKTGRFQLNKELDLDSDWQVQILRLDDIVEIIKYLLKANREKREVKELEHLSCKRVRRIGGLLSERLRIGLTHLAGTIQQGMNMQSPESITLRSLINARAVRAALNDFFSRAELSQYLDQTNPLAELTHKRRLSALGPGGLRRIQAKEETRDVHYTHYGRICPIETPEGENIGLITSLATYARINKFGFLETPYRKVVSGKASQEIVYLDARKEDEFYIASADTIDKEGSFLSSELIGRYRGEIISVPSKKIDCIDVSPQQMLSVSTSLIPFLENNDANRALMGSNMQCQAVPLENPEQPFVQTGMEGKVAANSVSGLRAKREGRVILVDANQIRIKSKSSIEEYKLSKFKRSNQKTCLNQRPIVCRGDRVKKGDFIADGAAICQGKLSLGRNVLVAFMPWEGYNFEDAILISEELVREDIFTSIHIEEFQVEAKELSSGVEKITAQVPDVDESSLQNLDQEGIVKIGTEVEPGDILVGKVTPQAEIEPTARERLLGDIFGEKAEKVKNNSLTLPHGIKGKVIIARVFSQENKDDLPADVKKKVKLYVAIRRKIRVGDKICGRHGNKGIVAKVLPEEDMPYLSDGTPVQVVLNPLGVPSRMNIGQILEMHLGWVAKTLNTEMICPAFEGPRANQIRALLKKAHLPESGKTVLCDGRTGRAFDGKVAVGYMYMMRLIQIASEKIHARSTGPYSLVTQQPLGGKSRQGGQRFGEMEVWALEGHGAAYTLQEMLTSKSDNPQARSKMRQQIIRGENLFDTETPESFKVLVKELQSLGLNLAFWKNEEKLPIKSMQEKEAIEGKPLWGMNNIDRISLRLASPEEMREWSYGEVSKAGTINYRTLKPEKGGLFCEEIFGPSRDCQCSCGKYTGMEHKGVRCENCGVEIISSKVRRERMGHIELASPVAHIWYAGSYLPLLLGLKKKELEKVICFISYLVIDADQTSLKTLQILEEEEYQERKKEYGEDSFQAGSGAEVILNILEKMDIEHLKDELEEQLLQEKSKDKKLKLIRRLQVVKNFLHSGNKPEWMILKVIPVIPPGIRPMLQLESGAVASSGLNDLYQAVINTNNQLKHLQETGASQIVVLNQKKMLQQAVDALLENEKLPQPVLGRDRKPLKSLTEIIKGKQGRFRQNLLGKRVDYSGRAVIVPGPDLKIYQCGLPESMALELFRPFVLGEIMREGRAETIKRANELLRKSEPLVWRILDKVVKDHPVLLNRAPTLHRLGIQAFQPVLIEGNAIQLHPLVCHSFNADFDGDQMAVHIPLSYQARLEAKTLLLSSNNILSAANGEAIVIPTQDIAAGCYYLTLERRENGKERAFSCPEEAILAYQLDKLRLHEGIKLFIDEKWVQTTVGRVIFNQVLPQEMKFQNRLVDKKTLVEIFSIIWQKYGNVTTAEVLDKIKKLGFAFATQSGLTFAFSDIPKIKEKGEFLSDNEREVKKLNSLAKKGKISQQERYIEIISLRTRVAEQIGKKVLQYLSRNPLNPLYLMWKSGARGSADQLRQIVGMRGLMAKPIRETYAKELWEEAFKREPNIPPHVIKQYFYPISGGAIKGRIGEEPVRSSFEEGLTAAEYFISTSGGRKGLIDTALKTAYAGYLTRKLVAAAENVIITEKNCATTTGIFIGPRAGEKKEAESLKKRIVGRITASSVTDPSSKKLIVQSKQEITEKLAERIEKCRVKRVKIRSPLTCQAEWGLCQRCYGWDLSTHRLVNLGQAVGVIAAQSIGEPGTQMTLRTFHTGGIFQKGGDIPQGLARVTELFEPRKEDYLRTLLNIKGIKAVQEYLINQTQQVYKSQAININVKHFEVIIRQMMRKVEVEEPGDTDYLPGQQIDKAQLEEVNRKAKERGERPATVKPVLLTIPKAAQEDRESFLSAASFQKTEQVLAEAAISGQVDTLRGLKANVIIGKLIPAGTGFRVN